MAIGPIAAAYLAVVARFGRGAGHRQIDIPGTQIVCGIHVHVYRLLENRLCGLASQAASPGRRREVFIQAVQVAVHHRTG